MAQCRAPLHASIRADEEAPSVRNAGKNTPAAAELADWFIAALLFDSHRFAITRFQEFYFLGQDPLRCYDAIFCGISVSSHDENRIES
jgi:hypothetical protein